MQNSAIQQAKLQSTLKSEVYQVLPKDIYMFLIESKTCWIILKQGELNKINQNVSEITKLLELFQFKVLSVYGVSDFKIGHICDTLG